MSNIDLTKRQRSALYAIHKIKARLGISPSFKELRIELEAKSDRSVTQLLTKLEASGYIKREKNKARSINITKKAYTDFPELSLDKYKRLVGNNFLQINSEEISPRQKSLLKKLSKINSKFASIYRGAIYVISEKKSTDWIAQSAHSFREIFMIMSNGAKTLLSEQQAAREDKFVTSMGTLNDPRSGLVILKDLIGETIYDEWNRFHNRFVKIAHHEVDINQEDYLDLIFNYEEFLMKYAFAHQANIYKLIDEEIKKGPAKVKAEDIRRLITRNLSAIQYFFDRIDEKWLSFVFNNRFLLPLQMSGEYLVRITREVPEEVMVVIDEYDKKYIIDSDNKYFRNYFIVSAINMPNGIAIKLVDKIVKEKWIKNDDLENKFWSLDMVKLLKKFITEEEDCNALKLADELLDVKLEKNGSRSLRDVTAYVDKYFYHEIVNAIEDVPVGHLYDYLMLLISKLRKASTLLYGRLEESHDKDSSYIWFQFIKENRRLNSEDVCEALISSIENLLIKYFDYLIANKTSNDDIIAKFDRLIGDSDDYYAFQMIQISLYRRYPLIFKEKIQWTIIEKFDLYELSLEYDPLVLENFNIIDTSFQKKYLELIKIGPKDENDADYIRRWKISKYALVSKYLVGDYRKQYIELLNGEKEPDVSKKSMMVTTTWVGPTTPKNEQELERLTIDELIELFIKWQPSGDDFGDSRLGLAREFSKLVNNKPEQFSADANKFNNLQIKPVYIYQYFFGLREARKDKIKKINWKEVIKLIHDLTINGRSNMLSTETFDEDGFNIDWDTVFQYAANLIEDGLNSDSIRIEDRKTVWEIISYICENKEPTLEYEKKYGGDNMDLFSVSINTARGVAFHALFAYIFWVDRNLKLKENKLPRIVDEAKLVLEQHLSKAIEPGNTIQSVYGKYFPWVYLYDEKWARKVLPQIFPLDDQERRYAAWESYLINGVFVGVFDALKPQYEKAIQELSKRQIRRKSRLDSKERLVAHMMIAYSYKIVEIKDGIFQLFFNKLNNELKGEAVNFIGRAYIMSTQEKIEMPDISRLKLFWEWRLEENNSSIELQNFGWWIKVDVFNNEWMLKMLIRVLVKTKGSIDADFHVIKALDKLAGHYPQLVSEALLLFIGSRDKTYGPVGYSHREEIKSIITSLSSVKNKGVRANVDDIIDQMLRLGHVEYMEIKKTLSEGMTSLVK